MFGALGPIGGAISMGADILGGVNSARQAEENQRRDIAAKERMAKNKNQWAVADMKAAGLNPILAAGGGVSSAGGAAGGTASGAPPGTNFHSSASARALIKADKDLKGQTTATGKAQEDKTKAETVTAVTNSAIAANQLEQSKIMTNYAKEHPELWLMDQGAGGGIINAVDKTTGIMGGLKNLFTNSAKGAKAVSKTPQKKAAQVRRSSRASSKKAPNATPNYQPTGLGGTTSMSKKSTRKSRRDKK